MCYCCFAIGWAGSSRSSRPMDKVTYSSILLHSTIVRGWSSTLRESRIKKGKLPLAVGYPPPTISWIFTAFIDSDQPAVPHYCNSPHLAWAIVQRIYRKTGYNPLMGPREVQSTAQQFKGHDPQTLRGIHFDLALAHAMATQ